MKVELSSKELNILRLALQIDVVSDHQQDSDKKQLLDKLNSIIEKLN